MPASVLTRPVATVSSIPGTTSSNITVNPSNTVVVDQCPTISNAAVKWIYTLIDQVTSQSLTAEVLATHRNGINPTHSRYAVIGDAIGHTANVGIFSLNIGLQITNLGTNPLSVNIIRLQILS